MTFSRMIRGGPKTCSLALVAVFMAMAAVSQAGPLPNKLTLLAGGPAGTTIFIDNVVYSTTPANAGVPVAGTGDFKCSIAGIDLPAQASLPFMNVVADDTGQITGGGIKLKEDMPFNNALGTGVDFLFKKDAQFTVLLK